MSAVTLRVSSDKQTLILAGEPIPPRQGSAGDSNGESLSVSPQLQRVPVLVVQEDYAAAPLATPFSSSQAAAPLLQAPAALARSLAPYSSSSRAVSAGAAEYARTQNADSSAKSQIIDTYA
jgi:hypothetical protein